MIVRPIIRGTFIAIVVAAALVALATVVLAPRVKPYVETPKCGTRFNLPPCESNKMGDASSIGRERH